MENITTKHELQTQKVPQRHKSRNFLLIYPNKRSHVIYIGQGLATIQFVAHLLQSTM